MRPRNLQIAFFLATACIFFKKAVAQDDVVYIPGSTKKINQLVGDWDNERGQPTQNRTYTRYGIPNTDLGVPFDHDGKTFVAFGDIFNDDRDPLGYSTDTDPEDGIALDFVTYPNGSFKPVVIPGVSLGGFGVPLEGVSWNNAMYIYASNTGMVNSVVAKSIDNGLTFTKQYDLSNSKFVNVSVVKTKSTFAYPEDPNSDIQVMFGSGTYRQSDVFLAYQHSDLMDTRSLVFFAGMVNGSPTWSNQEASAVPLFNQPCVGELSVSYNQFINKWIMLYNCESPRGINCRTADNPWGPWSSPFVIFEPTVDGGYCNYIHKNWQVENCDNVHDPGRENEWGGEYGPYQFENLAKGNEYETTIYYTMSTWNPYTVVLMKSTLRKKEIIPGIYRLVAKHSNKALDNSGFPGSGERNVVQWDLNGLNYQNWQIEPVGNDYYKLTNVHSGEVLDLGGCNGANGANVQQWPWLDNDCQKWRIEILGEGYYKLTSKSSGKVLEVNGSQANGGNVQQWDWLGFDWQQWYLEPVITPGVYRVTAKHSYKALDNSAFPGSQNRNVVQWEWYGDDIQKWQFDPVENGYFRITSLESGEVLDLDSCTQVNGGNVQQWPWLDNDCQKWRPEYLGNGHFRLISKSSGKVLEVNGSQVNGGNVQQWSWNGADWQQWKLDKLAMQATPLTAKIPIEKEDEDAHFSFKLYPNPSFHKFEIVFYHDHQGAGLVKMHDLQGKIVVEDKITVLEGMNEHEIMTGSLPKGIYFMELQLPNLNRMIVRKVIIKE
ncbi:MAG: RICIN domain-containing protein [Allomuricauda sp.]|jgi:hypothetical protein|uniref:RICIN domain-containing protein n=1 Tax=Allomuricauda sp. CP2A TaxID=1848189 RepID=UPI00082A766B|nr:RICIN domain-containing protein [Muricauda sp. CP2A]